MPPSPAPVTLTGRFVRLEPLARTHLDALAAVAFDPALWRWTTTQLHTRADLERYVDDALRLQSAGSALPFATVHLGEDRVVGSTRYGNISATDGRYEIGWTWVAPRWQRTAVNTEAKYLMLRHAFEALGARRVELKTHARNDQSRKAIERIGAQFEGIHRNHMLMYDGTMRDTAWYSIIDAEWPGVKGRLEERLATGSGATAAAAPR